MRPMQSFKRDDDPSDGRLKSPPSGESRRHLIAVAKERIGLFRGIGWGLEPLSYAPVHPNGEDRRKLSTIVRHLGAAFTVEPRRSCLARRHRTGRLRGYPDSGPPG